VYEAETPDIRFWDLYFQSARGSTTNDQSIEPAIPGMQEKISASTITFGVRFRGYPSGILKLNPRAYPKLVENEAFWLAVARDAEIEVSESRVVRDRDGESGLLVERFDRLRTKLGILKRHQEDGCQLLDLPPAQKYTPSFNAVLKAILNVVDSPRTDALRALQLYMFSYAVGNADLHAKNLSVIWADATRLSPAYDLLSTLPYDLSTNMALTLDGKNDQFKWIHFRRFAHRFGVSDRAFTRAAQSIDRAVRGAMDRVDIIGFPSATTDRMRAAIFDRLRRLGGIAAEGGGDSVA
jgi:serine/threonine-protein kinase HipA